MNLWDCADAHLRPPQPVLVPGRADAQSLAIPVLIHLINMLRHHRVDWAAMEFLLLSQKKHRTWIILKQLLLLLLRMMAVAAVVLLVAQPRLQNDWPGWLGGVHTHHIVLLDDSFSMSDRWGDTDAFAEGKKVVRRIAAGAARQEGLHWFTLLRFSRADRAHRPPQPDQLETPMGSDFGEKLEALLAKMQVSQSAAGPEPALDAVAKLFGGADSDRRIVYLVSDFRARDWGQRSELPKQMRELTGRGAEFRLIDCVDRQRPNLAITLVAAGARHPRGGRGVEDGGCGAQLRSAGRPAGVGGVGRGRPRAQGRGDRRDTPGEDRQRTLSRQLSQRGSPRRHGSVGE